MVPGGPACTKRGVKFPLSLGASGRLWGKRACRLGSQWFLGSRNHSEGLIRPSEQQRARAAGTRLGLYEIVFAIGAGGMGEVYRARDTRLTRTVAIKVLPPLLSADERLKQRVELESGRSPH